METIVSRKEARERLHRRALSQASTASSTMHSPTKTTKSTSTSSSQQRAITPSNAPHTHRYHHAQCDKELAALRQEPRLSRTSSGESKSAMNPVSSLLQERLQQERRAESERLASKWGADLSSSTGDIRDGEILNTPSKRNKPGAERRPRSSHDDDSSQTSMGAKQTEKVVSVLHKQNFDLKLELFHRRQKQSVLETRVEELETERQELTDVQENLLAELVKRDKAIEEAVNMIVKLELRVDELARERETGQHIEADGSYQHSWSNMCDSLRTKTPKPSDHGVYLSIEPKSLERMPSFLSDRSAQTQHLRSVVLQNNASLRHIRGVSEISASSAEVSEANHVASPSLSVLSESSFVSIYGSKQGQDEAGLMPLGDALGMDGTFGERSPTPTMRTINPPSYQKTSGLNRTLHLTRAATYLPNQILPTNNVLKSHVKRMEQPGEKTNFVDDTFRRSTSGRRKSVVTPVSQFMGSPSQGRNRQERSQTLQKVMTNYPTHKELANTHPLPPTPDTVSSSVLRTQKDQSNSQDSLSRSDDAQGPRNFAASLPYGNEYLRSLASQEVRPGMNAQNPSSSAVARNRSGLPTPGFIKVDQDALLSDLSHLTYSAANNANAGRPRKDSFVSDSDSDGGADAHSDTENYDYWMRESYKPDKANARSSARHERRRSPSPDLFSFPANSEGWQPDAMFGALKGAGFLGSPDPALRRDPIDELGASLQSPELDSSEPTPDGPQPPSRRSSLNAQAAGHFLLSSLTGKTGRASSREGGIFKVDAKGRRNSIDGSGAQANSGATTKRSQYPPISGLQSRARGLGLNSLFRRSGSESYGAPLSATESTFPSSVSQRGPPPSPAHFRHLRRPSGRNSVPPPATMPWVPRPIHAADNEFASATPPPIMRNRPPPLQADLAGPDMLGSELSQATDVGVWPVTPVIENTPLAAPQNGGGMRKWLGLGRKASPKIRAG
ncbi:hypothetical protein EV127DRAFT_413542 [Xylaria flabelliformis]|nr:hypothetical protein EV127DRAFT_413542 [Xylaria flabelliformis]